MNCIVCLDEVTGDALCCASNHALCESCCDPYVHEQVTKLQTMDLIAAKADTASATGDTRLEEQLAGAVHCPLRGHGCDAPPFHDRALALRLDGQIFAEYVQAKTLLPAARKVQQVLQQRSELSHMLPNARQCGRCSYGPIMLAGCSNLTLHHGEVRSGSAVPIDNSCPRCSWFRPEAHMWPPWEPNALGNEDVSAAAFEGSWAVDRPRADRERTVREEREGWLQEQRERREQSRLERQRELSRLQEQVRERRAALNEEIAPRPDRERRERAPWLERARERLERAREQMGQERYERELDRLNRHQHRYDLMSQMMMDESDDMPPPLPPLLPPPPLLSHPPAQAAPPAPAAMPELPEDPEPPPPHPSLPPVRVMAGCSPRVQRAAEAAAAAAASRAPIDGLEADLVTVSNSAPPPAEPHACQRERKQRALALFERLTGLGAQSLAASMYIDDADGDVEAAVRAAVQGAAGYGEAGASAAVVAAAVVE